VAGELLRDGGVASVLKRAGDEFVADRVPRQTFAAAKIQAGESKQLPPHPLEVLDRPTVCTPWRCARRGEQGSCRQAIIGRNGAVSSVRVLSAQVHPDFAIAAVDAVRQWRYTPTLLNGVPVDVVMTVTVRFDLED
jgi:TonB family protein